MANVLQCDYCGTELSGKEVARHGCFFCSDECADLWEGENVDAGDTSEKEEAE